MNDLAAFGRGVGGEDQFDGFQVVFSSGLARGVASQRGQQVGVAVHQAGVGDVVGRIGPGVVRRGVTLRLGALRRRQANEVVRANLSSPVMASQRSAKSKEMFCAWATATTSLSNSRMSCCMALV